jgi:hypothetical protein
MLHFGIVNYIIENLNLDFQVVTDFYAEYEESEDLQYPQQVLIKENNFSNTFDTIYQEKELQILSRARSSENAYEINKQILDIILNLAKEKTFTSNNKRYIISSVLNYNTPNLFEIDEKTRVYNYQSTITLMQKQCDMINKFD